MEIRRPRLQDEVQMRIAHSELKLDDFDFMLEEIFDISDFSGYLSRLADFEVGQNLPQGYVPSLYLLAAESDEILGRVSIRFQLNDFLHNFGGHIGYAVRPKSRNRGIAKQLLNHSLMLLHKAGEKRALITCLDDNLASAAVIESKGGVLENVVDFQGKRLRRYWISLSDSSTLSV